MTKEEKRLLLIDLCARLPYGIIVHIHDINVDDYDRQLIAEDIDFIELDRRNCKPYLRPMSSMTDDERFELWKKTMQLALQSSLGLSEFVPNTAVPAAFEIDYYNAHHFDFRGLIPMGLALEAPEGMYETE